MTTVEAPVVGSFIFDWEHRLTGVVEEIRDGLVHYYVRQHGSQRGHYRWTPLPQVSVLLDDWSVEDDRDMAPRDRMMADLLHNAPHFSTEGERLFWQDRDGTTYEVELGLNER